MRKLGFFVMLVFGLILADVAPAAAAAGARISTDERDVLSFVNANRAAGGLSPLVLDAELVSIARAHSQDMADSGVLGHNASLPSQVKGWRSIGENVGTGPDVDTIDDQFLASDVHRGNILGNYRDIGIGVVADADGTAWVTQVFVDPASPAAAPAPRSVARPKPRVTHPGAARPAPSPRAPVTRAPVTRAVAADPVVARSAPEGLAVRAVALLERMTDE